jgi:hypothetical protein
MRRQARIKNTSTSLLSTQAFTMAQPAIGSAAQPAIGAAAQPIIAAPHIITPMPTPGAHNTPYFKGKYVNNFLDSLEVHADSAGIQHNDLPAYILHYCH